MPKITQTENRNKIVDAIHFDQRDNSIDKYKTCFPTSVAMGTLSLELQKLKPRISKQELLKFEMDEWILNDMEKNKVEYKNTFVKIMGPWAYKYNPRYFYKWWQHYCENILGGFIVEHVHKPNPIKIKTALNNNKLIVCGTTLTSAGHVILINGYHHKHDGFYCNDPYGEAHGKNNYISHDGEGVFYHDYWWLGSNMLILENK